MYRKDINIVDIPERSYTGEASFEPTYKLDLKSKKLLQHHFQLYVFDVNNIMR